MTLIAHSYRFIFLKSRKTAGTSIEASLLRYMGGRDLAATAAEAEPLDLPALCTPNRTKRGMKGEQRLKRALRWIGQPKMQLREHMHAADVRRLVGQEIWARYTSFTVERDPWRRVVSLWRWRQRRESVRIDFERFLSALEAGDRQSLRAVHGRHWSNWCYYTIDDQLAVDRVLRYENLAEDLAAVTAEIGLPFDGWLPQTKVSEHADPDPATILTEEQIDRISRLFANEIAMFGYSPPH